MKGALAFILGLCLLPMAARASVIYEFEMTRVTGVGLFPEHPFPGMSYSLEISDAAFAAGGLDIEYIKSGGVAVGACGGLLGFEVGAPGGDVSGIPSRCEGYFGTGSDNLWLYVDLTLIDGGQSLAGSFFFSDSNSDWQLASVGGDLWAGTLVTDDSGTPYGCFDSQTPCAYEGVWRLISGPPSAIPESGSLALVLVGLGGLLTTRRRQGAG